ERRQSKPRWRPKPPAALPAFRQLSIGPIPQQIEDYLALPACDVSKRLEKTDVCADMLPAADGDLHLRYYVPSRLCSSHKIALRNELHHWRPQTAKTIFGCEALS